MVIDTTKCNGCYNCFIACRDEFCGNEHTGYAASQPESGHFWMRIVERERGKFPKVKVAYIPVACMHCENAPCVAAAKNGAVYRRPDGVVIIDPEKSKNQKQIVEACPYRVIYWNDEKKIPQKCNFCVHLLDAGWKEPRCVEACPTDALVFGDLDDSESEVFKLRVSKQSESIHPEYQLKERITYIGLPKRFVAGSVVLGDTGECAEGAAVTLGGTKTVKTNNYGDFEFEGLPEDTIYEVKVDYSGYKSQIFTIRTKVDIYLGDITLLKE
ncbi:MAG: carboxypeptidase regulatory-like domain-containing protein [Deltaproteobacteria bacterium]|nr:carboxypeptidase regulatory-like domain-containing protein [Deltaproteobacteria bacterium]